MVICFLCYSHLGAVDVSSEASLPNVLGDEGAGIVESVGAHVACLRPGELVLLALGSSCHLYHRSILRRLSPCGALPCFGLVDPACKLFRLEGASFGPVGPVTYLRCRRPEPAAMLAKKDVATVIGFPRTAGIGAKLNATKLLPGDSLVGIGVGGGGLNAIQGGVVAGTHEVAVIDIDASSIAYVTGLDATHVVDLTHTDPTARLTEVGLDGVDAVMVASGSAAAIEAGCEFAATTGVCVRVGADATVKLVTSLIVDCSRRPVGTRFGVSDPGRTSPTLFEFPSPSLLLRLDELGRQHTVLGQTSRVCHSPAARRPARGLIATGTERAPYAARAEPAAGLLTSGALSRSRARPNSPCPARGSRPNHHGSGLGVTSYHHRPSQRHVARRGQR